MTFPSEETGVINPKVTDHCDVLKIACVSLVQGIFCWSWPILSLQIIYKILYIFLNLLKRHSLQDLLTQAFPSFLSSHLRVLALRRMSLKNNLLVHIGLERLFYIVLYDGLLLNLLQQVVYCSIKNILHTAHTIRYRWICKMKIL